ncbi:hypothetical protein [Enterococcus hailinensis]|uniref:hypothetical protein n=1 Tax=Enterococcus hailinensis TaxID=3238988 RepID=UPI0038B3D4D2
MDKLDKYVVKMDKLDKHIEELKDEGKEVERTSARINYGIYKGESGIFQGWSYQEGDRNQDTTIELAEEE